jgi:hypothetical protein
MAFRSGVSRCISSKSAQTLDWLRWSNTSAAHHRAVREGWTLFPKYQGPGQTLSGSRFGWFSAPSARPVPVVLYRRQ